MHYYKRNTGDWLQATIGYSYAEQGILLRLIDIYHIREGGIPAASVERLVAPRDDAERDALHRVLEDHFELIQPGDETQTVSVTEPTWINGQCERDIEAYHAKADTNRKNGKAGGRPRKDGMKRHPARQNHAADAQAGQSTEPKGNPHETQSVFCGNPDETLTTNLLTSVLRTGEPSASPPVRSGREPAADRRSPVPDAPKPSPSPQAQAVVQLMAETIAAKKAEAQTPKCRLWRDGLAQIKTLTGKSDRYARPLIGKMLDQLRHAPGIVDPEAELLEIIDRAAADRPSEPVAFIEGAIRARTAPPADAAPSGISPGDPPEAWEGIADSFEIDRITGRPHPICGLSRADVVLKQVIEAARMRWDWRGDVTPLARWLRQIGQNADIIVPNAVRDRAAWRGYEPPASLAFFDAAVRKTRPAAAA